MQDIESQENQINSPEIAPYYQVEIVESENEDESISAEVSKVVKFQAVIPTTTFTDVELENVPNDNLITSAKEIIHEEKDTIDSVELESIKNNAELEKNPTSLEVIKSKVRSQSAKVAFSVVKRETLLNKQRPKTAAVTYEVVPDNPALLIQQEPHEQKKERETKHYREYSFEPITKRENNIKRTKPKAYTSAFKVSDKKCINDLRIANNSARTSKENSDLNSYSHRPPPKLLKYQTSRNHLEKYKIEQIALRRLRFVIENNEAQQDHLSIIDLIQQSNVPPKIIQSYFGREYKTACDIRVLLLKSIEKSNQLHTNSQSHIGNHGRDSPSNAFNESNSKQVIRIFSKRVKPTTPEDVLEVIEEASIRSASEYHCKFSDQTPFFWKHTSDEKTKHASVNSTRPQQRRPCSASSITGTVKSVHEAEREAKRLSTGKNQLQQMVLKERTEQEEAIAKLTLDQRSSSQTEVAVMRDPVLSMSSQKLLRLVENGHRLRNYTMDVVKSVQHYLSRMISEVSGMKVLLLDSETTPIISLVVTQSQLLSREIYLIDRLDNQQRDKMRHLKCICFVRPSAESIQALVDELREPCYGDYFLYFSNTLKKSAIERLAEVDEQESVREVQEFFADFHAINPDLFSLNLTAPQYPLFIENSSTWDSRTFARTTEGIIAVLLALKKKPLIRYQRNSALAKKLSSEVSYQIQQEGPLFDFRRTDTPPILLILDRRNDPVTPLLLQWTYQAMVHELLGITNGRVDLSSVPEVRPELREVVLSIDHDPFYKNCQFLNMGDLGVKIKEYVTEYQTKHKSSMNIESINDMKRFVEEYPEFRKLSGNVTKHVTLVGELSRLVERQSLLEVSELEQNLAVAENHTQDLKTIQKLIEKQSIPEDYKVKLVTLYALRYEKSPNNATPVLLDLLARNGVSDKKINLINAVLTHAGADQRQDDLFFNENVVARAKTVLKGLKGVENVYTQHQPLLIQTLEALIKGKLKDASYPFVEGGTKDRPQDVIVFIIGGVTYAEAREVSKLNAANNPGVRIVLGGSTVHSSDSFLKEVQDSVIRCVNVKANSNSPKVPRIRSGRLEL